MLKADIQHGPHRKNEVETVPEAEGGPGQRPLVDSLRQYQPSPQVSQIISNHAHSSHRRTSFDFPHRFANNLEITLDIMTSMLYISWRIGGLAS